MTDKVHKIREEVAKIQLYTQSEVLKQVLDYIDEVQKEPVSMWHNASEEPKPNMELICVGQCGNPLVLSSNSDSFKSRYISKWAYFNDLLNLSNVQRTVKNWKEPVSDDLEKVVEEIVDPTVLNAYGVKEIANRLRRTMIDSVSDDLGEYINKLSKQFPEVSFAKLSRIAVRVAKWKEQQLMANAVEGVVHHFEKCKVASVHYNDPTGVPMAYFTSQEGLSAGDKVKINVIKED